MRDPQDVVFGYKRRIYARLMLAMSRSEALGILGLTGYPAPEAIQKSWKTLALQNHPDRGGDLEKMKQINVARDVLVGVQKPTLERGPAPGWTPPGQSSYSYNKADDALDLFASAARRNSSTVTNYLTENFPKWGPWKIQEPITVRPLDRACRVSLSGEGGAWFVVMLQRESGKSYVTVRLAGLSMNEFTVDLGSRNAEDLWKDPASLFGKALGTYSNNTAAPRVVPGTPFNPGVSGVTWGVAADSGYMDMQIEGTFKSPASFVTCIGRKADGSFVVLGCIYRRGREGVNPDGTRLTAEPSFTSTFTTVKEAKHLPKAIQAVAKSFLVEFDLPRKFTVMSPALGTLNQEAIEKVSKVRGSLTLKDALAGAGFLDEAAGAGRKIQVEISMDKVTRNKATRQDEIDGTIYFNGKAYPLSNAAMETLWSDIVFSKAFRSAPLGYKVNITKSRGGMFRLNPVEVLEHLATILSGESSQVVVNLQQAIEAAEDATAAKVASSLLAVWTPLEAEIWSGVPAYDLLTQAYGLLLV